MLKSGSFLFLLLISVSGCSFISDKLSSYEIICNQQDADCLQDKYRETDFITPMSTGGINPRDSELFTHIFDIYSKSLENETIQKKELNIIIKGLTSNIESQQKLYKYAFNNKKFNVNLLISNELIVYFNEIKTLQYMQYENKRQLKLIKKLKSTKYLVRLKHSIEDNSEKISNALTRIVDTIKNETKVEIEMLNYFKLLNIELNTTDA